MAAGLERQTVKGTLEAESMVLGCTEPEAGHLQVSSGLWAWTGATGARNVPGELLEPVTQAALGADHSEVTGGHWKISLAPA